MDDIRTARIERRPSAIEPDATAYATTLPGFSKSLVEFPSYTQAISFVFFHFEANGASRIDLRRFERDGVMTWEITDVTTPYDMENEND